MSTPEILRFVTTVDCCPNVSIAYRILLTVPVTVASAERSFSKLKLLKNYLRSTMLQQRLNGLAMCSIEKDILNNINLERSTMLQQRLNGLAMCSIEKDILNNINLDSVINDFASRNARRSFFVKE
jgi:hypothetical protein